MEADSLLRLALALSAAGLLLLVLEVFFPASGFAVFGMLAISGSVGLGLYFISIDFAAILLLVHSTLVSLGLLVVLARFPRSPLAARFLRRAAERRAEEEEKEKEE